MSIKGRRVTPALRLRPLQPYVSAALRPERKRVRNGQDISIGLAVSKSCFLSSDKKRLPSCKRTKAISLVLTTCYNILELPSPVYTLSDSVIKAIQFAYGIL